jgi:hypothetical protein
VSIQDVAVKVLIVQDFHDDQLREFLREVCKSTLSISSLLFADVQILCHLSMHASV